MALKFNVILYGSDTDVAHDSNGTALVTALEALPATEYSTGVYWITPQDTLEGSTIEVPGSQKFFYGLMRGSMQLITEYFTLANYETARTGLRAVLEKKYTWIEVVDFPVTLHTAGRAIAVTISGLQTETQAGLKNFTLDLENRFGY
jgi:rhamnogalacturonyl hydrolase YesR